MPELTQGFHLGSEVTQGFHLGSKLSKPLESVWVQFLDGDGDAVGELSLVDESEAAVADDQVGGEVLGGDDQLVHGDSEVGVEGSALIDGDGRVLGYLGSSVAVGRCGSGFLGLSTEDDQESEDQGYEEEACSGCNKCLETVIHKEQKQRERLVCC